MGPAAAKTLSSSTHSFQELPVWARAAAMIGIPGVLAFYLVWLLGTAFTAKIDAHAHESREGTTKQLLILQQICANTADTPEERAACWGIRP